MYQAKLIFAYLEILAKFLVRCFQIYHSFFTILIYFFFLIFLESFLQCLSFKFLKNWNNWNFILGLDFAWSTNGYVYHTRFDNADQIPLGSLQRTGDNILALTRSIATGPHLPYAQSQKSEGSLVFFDFLGAFVVQWSQRVACLVNLCSIFIGMFSIYLNIKSARKGTTYKKNTILSGLSSDFWKNIFLKSNCCQIWNCILKFQKSQSNFHCTVPLKN